MSRVPAVVTTMRVDTYVDALGLEAQLIRVANSGPDRNVRRLAMKDLKSFRAQMEEVFPAEMADRRANLEQAQKMSAIRAGGRII